jgi:hypothetical protein
MGLFEALLQPESIGASTAEIGRIADDQRSIVGQWRRQKPPRSGRFGRRRPAISQPELEGHAIAGCGWTVSTCRRRARRSALMLNSQPRQGADPEREGLP